MAATDPQTLIASAACFNCFLPVGGLLKLGLLKEIALALNPMADTSPQNLINIATCYRCVAQPDLLELGLLALIAQNGTPGGGGLSGITEGTSNPPPTDGSITTLLYKDTNTGFKWVNLGTVVAPDWDSI